MRREVEEAVVDIDEMEAGREMDARIQEFVFGDGIDRDVMTYLFSGYDDPEGWAEGEWRRIPDYSTDDAAACSAIDEMRHKYDLFLYCVDSHYACQVWRDEQDAQPLSIAKAKTMPLAVCRALLKAVDAVD